MEKDDEKKKTTIPLKTVNTIIRDVLGDKVKVSKSFVKLVRQFPVVLLDRCKSVETHSSVIWLWS